MADPMMASGALFVVSAKSRPVQTPFAAARYLAAGDMSVGFTPLWINTRRADATTRKAWSAASQRVSPPILPAVLTPSNQAE
jgi:hypothetical protein